MKSAYFLSGQAQRELDSALQYVAERDRTAARKLAARFNTLFRTIASNRGMGELVETQYGAVRRFTMSSYVVFYDDRGDRPYVVRILHGARDIDSLME